MDEIEYRAVSLDTLETRLAPDEQGTFSGYACRYDVIDSYGTAFRSGCWAAGGLDTGTYALLRMHNAEEPVGTFSAREDETGLWIEGRFDPTPEGLSARARALSGSQPELSVGFVRVGVDPDNPDYITSARLVEVSAITARMASQPGAALASVRAKVQCSGCGKFVQRVRCPKCSQRVDETGLETSEPPIYARRMAEPPEDSYEGLIEDLKEAVRDWAGSQYNPSGDPQVYVYVCIEATFSDRVVATVYVSGGDEDGYSWQFPYLYSDDVVTLGEPKLVDIVEQIVPADADDETGLSDSTSSPAPMAMSATVEIDVRRRKAAARLRLVSA
jgi:HK97 family phage prohead protease